MLTPEVNLAFIVCSASPPSPPPLTALIRSVALTFNIQLKIEMTHNQKETTRNKTKGEKGKI